MGCAIYDSRPSDCSIYSCAYLDRDFNSESLRPDRCGFIAEVVRWAEFKIAIVYEATRGSGVIENHIDEIIAELRPGLMIMRSDTGELMVHENDGDAADEFLSRLQSGDMSVISADGVVEKI